MACGAGVVFALRCSSHPVAISSITLRTRNAFRFLASIFFANPAARNHYAVFDGQTVETSARKRKGPGEMPGLYRSSALPAQFQSELDLAWIEGRGGLASIGPQDVHIGHVQAVERVEDVHHSIQSEPLRHLEMLGDADVVEDREWLAANVASQVAAKRGRDHAVGGIAVDEARGLDPSR